MTVAINIIRSRVPLFTVTISTIVVSRKLKAFDGKMLSKSRINSSWKLGIGINGISVKRKIEAGSRARRRLKAIDDALVTSTPFVNPFTTNLITWLIGIPSKPGRTSRLILSLLLKDLASLKFISYMALRLISTLFMW
jgi:hypothetical protein